MTSSLGGSIPQQLFLREMQKEREMFSSFVVFPKSEVATNRVKRQEQTDQEEHVMANQQQVKILLQGVDTWNQWRQKYPKIKVDLSGANLSNADLNNADLNNANLDGANLDGASLDGANLDGASLDGANLDGTNVEDPVSVAFQAILNDQIKNVPIQHW